ncbi:MAG: hypothetical protein ACRDGP_01180 [Actinomycetota bacterium]
MKVFRSAPKFLNIARRKLSEDEEDRLQNALRIAWAKELQLRIPGAFGEEVLPFLVHGSGIHAYYVVFHGGSRAIVDWVGRRPTNRLRVEDAPTGLGSWPRATT